jgi:two-component system cell cycle sensor histidine kinase/response regulator CckA
MGPAEVGPDGAGLAWPLALLAVLAAAGAGWLARGVVLRARRSKGSGEQNVPLADMLESALGATPIGIGFADRELRFVLVNQAFARFNGLTPTAHVGRPVRELLPARAWEIGEPLLRRVLETGEPVLGVHIRLGQPASREPVRDFYGNIFPVRGPWGRVLWVGATVLDVTARVRTEEERERLLAALRESEARFRALSESGVIGVLVADRERLVEANDAFLELIGYSRAEMLEGLIRWSGITPPEYAEADARALRELTETGVVRPFEKEYVRKDGSRVPVVVGGAVTGHQPLEWTSFVIDASERKRAEAEVRASEARYRSLFDRLPAPMWVYDYESFRFLDVNQAAIDQYGWTREEFLRMTIREIRPLEELAAFDEKLRRRGPGVTLGGRYRHQRKNGDQIEVEISSQEVLYGGMRARLVLATDVTARVRMQEDVQRFVSLVENAGDFIAMVSPERQLLYLNKAGRELMGFSDDLLVRGISVTSLWHEHSRDVLEQDVLPRLAEGQSWDFDGQLRHVVSGEPIEVECNAFGIRDAQTGRVLAGAFVVRDLTERKRVEEHLRQAQRMEAIGRLAGGVAHEVNNMMTVILGFCTFLARSLEETDERQQDVAQIARAAERSAEVSRQLLAYSRRQLLQARVLELNSVLLDMESVLRRLMGEDRDVVLRLGLDPRWIKTDRTQLEQVILNLALNARDAMPQGGRLAIETSSVMLDTEYAHRHPATIVRPGCYVMLTVSDTGRGMDPATQAQIFDPFFTTKPVGHGTGLGLSMAYGIVKQSGGYIWAYSEPGEGTTFKIYLPQVQESGEATAWVPAEATPRGAGETILVVEDEDLVRGFACRFLRNEGYVTRESTDGQRALELLQLEADTVDLVLTDAVMPRMGGRELADHLARLRPALPVLFMSGYTNDEIIRRGLLSPGAPYLQKPFSPEALAAKVREVLDASRGRRTEAAVVS